MCCHLQHILKPHCATFHTMNGTKHSYFSTGVKNISPQTRLGTLLEAGHHQLICFKHVWFSSKFFIIITKKDEWPLMCPLAGIVPQCGFNFELFNCWNKNDFTSSFMTSKMEITDSTETNCTGYNGTLHLDDLNL